MPGDERKEGGIVDMVGEARSDGACSDGGGDECRQRYRTRKGPLDSIEENQNQNSKGGFSRKKKTGTKEMVLSEVRIEN